MTKQFGTPGPRALHPEMCDSPSLGQCGILANALFPRLVAMADDQGRLAGDSYGLLVATMGRLLRLVTVEALEEALGELEGAGMLQRYEVRGAQLVQLLQWWRWQSGQRRAYPSRWPAPKGWADIVYGCAAAPDLERFEEALAASPRRNAAIRGNLPQSAADRGNPPLRTRAPMRAPTQAPVRAHAVPRTPTDTVPSAARNGATEAPSGGQAETSEFRRLVPRPGATEEVAG